MTQMARRAQGSCAFAACMCAASKYGKRFCSLRACRFRTRSLPAVSRKETGGSARLHLHFVVDPCRRASSRSESRSLSLLPLLSFPQFRSLVTGSSLSVLSALSLFPPRFLTSAASDTSPDTDTSSQQRIGSGTAATATKRLQQRDCSSRTAGTASPESNKQQP